MFDTFNDLVVVLGRSSVDGNSIGSNADLVDVDCGGGICSLPSATRGPALASITGSCLEWVPINNVVSFARLEILTIGKISLNKV